MINLALVTIFSLTAPAVATPTADPVLSPCRAVIAPIKQGPVLLRGNGYIEGNALVLFDLTCGTPIPRAEIFVDLEGAPGRSGRASQLSHAVRLGSSFVYQVVVGGVLECRNREEVRRLGGWGLAGNIHCRLILQRVDTFYAVR